MAYGAKIVSIDGNFDQALNAVEKFLTAESEIRLFCNPYRLRGQVIRSFFEISDDLGYLNYQFMPVGNAGNISSYFKGYKKYMDEKKSPSYQD